ncbi:MAG: hypothetical protein ABSF03_21690 [Streptosporangiaceae bacterium]|jgi:hypothetical protein
MSGEHSKEGHQTSESADEKGDSQEHSTAKNRGKHERQQLTEPGLRKKLTESRLWKQLTGTRLRKALTASAALIVPAAVAGAVTGISTGWFSGQPASTAGSPPPVLAPFTQASSSGCPTSSSHPPFAVSVYHESALDIGGLETAFPGKLNLNKADLQSLNKQGTGWLTGRGGYDIDTTHFKLTLTGCRFVRILNMRAVILSRSPPLSGTIFVPASQGGSPSVKLGFNLDSGSPVAAMDDGTGHFFDYFEKYTFTLSPREQDTFELVASTFRSAITWKLDIEYLINNQIANETIDNNGQPFKVSFDIDYNNPDPFRDYSAIYGQCWGYNGDWGSGESQPAVCHRAANVYWARLR